MADSDLQTKLSIARSSMTGDRDEPKRLLASELVKRRQSVLTFAGDTSHNSRVSLSVEDLGKRRAEARRAMESFEQKKRREAKEKAEAEKKQMTQRIEELKSAREELERKRATEGYQATQQATSQKLAAEREYQQNVALARAEIETITKRTDPAINTYRTLKTDFREEVQTKGLSMTKIALEEEARRRLETLPRETSSSKKPFMIIGLSLFLIVVGGLALYATIVLNQPTSTTVKPLVINSIAFADEHIELPTTTTESDQLKQAVGKALATSAGEDKILNIYPTAVTIIDGNRHVRLLTAQETLLAFDIVTPISFHHFLEAPIMLGVVTGSGATTSAPFFIFKTRSFENTFDTLLKEERMIMRNLLEPFVDRDIVLAISSGNFTDKLINNIDTRIIQVSSSTQAVALYGFLDRETLVVTTTEQAFSRILQAYQTPRPTNR